MLVLVEVRVDPVMRPTHPAIPPAARAFQASPNPCTTEGTEDTEVHRGNEVTGRIIGAAMTVHRQLGPGLLESAYEACIVLELAQRGVHFERQRPISFQYLGALIECAYRIDLLVEKQVIVELKSTAAIEPIHTAQMLTYLKLTGYRLGLLINFNVPLLKDGIHRIVL